MKLIEDAARALTTQKYGRKSEIGGVIVSQLKRFNDDGGALTEIARLSAGKLEAFSDFQLAQINFSEIDPGIVKAFHLHEKQTDIWYVPPTCKILLVLIDLRLDSPTRDNQMRIILGDCSDRLVLIPPGVAHGCKNVKSRTGQIIYLVDRQFSSDPEECDEKRLPWDFAGKSIWEVGKE